MKTQTTIRLNRQKRIEERRQNARRVQIEMMEKNLSRGYVRKKLRMKRSLFSLALSGDRIAALNKVVGFVRLHKASPVYLKK